MPFLKQFGAVSLESLGLLQRILLATDGTLTDALEAAFLEPVGIVKVSSTIDTTREPDERLGLDASSDVMHRRVRLAGERTGRTYAYAESTLALDRLPPAFRRGLVESDIPMGRLWVEHRLETLKEFLSVSRDPMGALAEHFPDAAGELLSRSYRLISGGSPLMVITERFPVTYGSS